MPRTKRVTSDTLTDAPFPELAELDPAAADPTPGQAPKRRGRPPGSTNKTGTRGRIATRTPSGRIASKAQMQAKVREEVELWLSLGQGLWETRDPECASTASPERIATIADSLTALIARSPRLLEYAASSGVIGDVIRLITAAAPIVVAVLKAHGPAGHGHSQDADINDVNDFPAYAAA